MNTKIEKTKRPVCAQLLLFLGKISIINAFILSSGPLFYTDETGF
jgi:hypothetical protein